MRRDFLWMAPLWNMKFPCFENIPWRAVCGGELMTERNNHFARHAEMLITLAEAVADAGIAACLVAEAADLTARIDDSGCVVPVAAMLGGTCSS